MADDRFFNVGQKAFIERSGEILVMFWNSTQMDFPGGRMQEGEFDIEAALKREVREETGLEIEVGRPFATWINEQATTYLVGFACTYRSGEVVLSEEHDGYRWVNSATYGELDDGRPHFAALAHRFEELARTAPAERSGADTVSFPD